MSIRLANLGYAYAEREALRGINHTFDEGLMTGLIGPNGSGKTTLLKLASGALRPTDGGATLTDMPICRIPERRRAQRIAVVPQHSHLDFDFTVLDLVLMGRQPYLGRLARERDEDMDLARWAMDALGIAALASRNARLLSGGEWQRVVIARALCQGTPYLLMDEPVSSLDIRHQMEVLSVIRALTRERRLTVLVVLHDLNLAAHYCDRLLLLGEGQLIARGTPASVLTEDNLQQVYGIHAHVEHSDEGGVRVLPEYL